MVNVTLAEEKGEIPPQLQKIVKTPTIKSDNKYIVDHRGDMKTEGEISTEAAVGSDNLLEKQTWFQNPVNCISRWSKALKKGVVHSIGLDCKHTAAMDSGENDNPNFSFFL